jgi:hypothetical protein
MAAIPTETAKKFPEYIAWVWANRKKGKSF